MLTTLMKTYLLVDYQDKKLNKKIMYKVRLRKRYGKYYDEIAIFHEEYYAREFVDAIKSKLYNVIITIVKENHTRYEKINYNLQKYE